MHHLHTFPQHLRTVFRNFVIHRRGPWQCLGKRGVLCAIHSLHHALYYPNKNVIVFGPKDFGSGACNIAITLTLAKLPGAAIQKRSGGCKVLGAEDARCEQDPRPSDFDPQENSQDVRAALGLKCIPCYWSVSRRRTELEHSERDWSRCDYACISRRPIPAPVHPFRS